MADAIATMKTRPRSVSPFFIANMLPDTASGQIAIELGIRGPNMCIVTACTTGTHNIGEAAEGIRRGDFHTVITGSTETPLFEVGYVGFSNMRGMGTPREGQPLSRHLAAVRPQPQRLRAGRGRGRHGARGPRDGQGTRRQGLRGGRRLRLRRATPGTSSSRSRRATARGGRWSSALQRHDVPRDEIDLINPHGTSTPLGDLRESQAIHSVFGDRATEIAISGTKSMTGHLMGAAGAVEGVFTVLSVFHQIAPRDPQLSRARPGDPAGRGPRRVTADAASATRCPTTSAWAATTARSSSSATTATDSTSLAGGGLGPPASPERPSDEGTMPAGGPGPCRGRSSARRQPWSDDTTEEDASAGLAVA